MSEYKGDFTTSNTIYHLFNTFDSNDPSASVTLTGLAVGDILIYKNGSVTQRSSTAGFTLLDTDGIDFDAQTGIHGFSIDLSDNTDAGFYAAGNEYTVVIASVTVDAATINFVAFSFSIERTGGVLALFKARIPSALVGGRMDSDIGAKTGNVALSTQEKLDVNAEADTALTDYDAPTRTEATADKDIIVTDLDDIKGTSFVKDTHSLIDLKTETVLIVADTNELQGDWVNGGRLDLLLDALQTDLDNATDGLGALKALIDTVNTDLSNGTDGLGALKILIDALNDLSAANILTEVNTALDAAISELAVAVPATTPSVRTGIMLLYMALRNKLDVNTTASPDVLEVHNDAGTIIAKKDLTDDGTDYSEAKMASG